MDAALLGVCWLLPRWGDAGLLSAPLFSSLTDMLAAALTTLRGRLPRPRWSPPQPPSRPLWRLSPTAGVHGGQAGGPRPFQPVAWLCHGSLPIAGHSTRQGGVVGTGKWRSSWPSCRLGTAPSSRRWVGWWLPKTSMLCSRSIPWYLVIECCCAGGPPSVWSMAGCAMAVEQSWITPLLRGWQWRNRSNPVLCRCSLPEILIPHEQTIPPHSQSRTAAE